MDYGVKYEVSDYSLPELLQFDDGGQVTTVEQWQVRRQEILDCFADQVYGKVMGDIPGCECELVDESKAMQGKAIRKLVKLNFTGNGRKITINFVVFIPANSSRPVPVTLFPCIRNRRNIDPKRDTVSEFWPAEIIVEKGYAAAAFQVSDVDPDTEEDVNCEDGIQGVAGQKRVGNSWGAISAWAWGASRCMDYLETVPQIDSKKVALVGHSRGGKIALWAGANDERFAITWSNCSGCVGAAIGRRCVGENYSFINATFPHWFCLNFREYNDNEQYLPVDQHMLLAAIAPRALYVSSASEDTWADPEGEYLSFYHASKAWEIFGDQSVDTDVQPQPESPVRFGTKLGYHLRTGKHDLNHYDWNTFLEFADNYFQK